MNVSAILFAFAIFQKTELILICQNQPLSITKPANKDVGHFVGRR
jgi:hypothetical protein